LMNSARASSRRPIAASASMYQKLHTRRAVSGVPKICLVAVGALGALLDHPRTVALGIRLAARRTSISGVTPSNLHTGGR
jgi:hypothetical protein